jgi:hypothetical protein
MRSASLDFERYMFSTLLPSRSVGEKTCVILGPTSSLRLASSTRRVADHPPLISCLFLHGRRSQRYVGQLPQNQPSEFSLAQKARAQERLKGGEKGELTAG